MALIEIRGLTKYYRMGDSVVRALDGVDLTVERGEFVAITGASGSGKSTMMHLLGCLDRPTSGTYRLDGRDVGKLSDRELAAVRNEQIGFVFQTFNLINRTTAWENVAVPLFYARKTNTRTPALRALERVGLKGRASHQPNELSGGERQRVAIARAIVNDPLLLMADEPTGNLDTRTGEQIMEIVHALNEQGVTIVMVTHEQDIAEQAQRIVQMRDGKIISDRLTKDILAAEGRSASRRPAISVDMDVAAATPSAAPVAQEPPPLECAALPPRKMRGAGAGFVCSLLGVLFWLTAIGVGVALQFVFAEELKAYQHIEPGMTPKMPPMPFLVASMVSGLSMITGLILAIVGIVLSMGARRRIRTEIGNWLGGRRALAGAIMGWLVVGLSVGGIALSIVSSISKSSSPA